MPTRSAIPGLRHEARIAVLPIHVRPRRISYLSVFVNNSQTRRTYVQQQSSHSNGDGRLESAPARTRRTRRSSAPWSACSTCSSRRSSENKSSVKRFPRHRSGDFRPANPGRVYRSVLLGRTMWAFSSPLLPRSGTRCCASRCRIWSHRHRRRDCGQRQLGPCTLSILGLNMQKIGLQESQFCRLYNTPSVVHTSKLSPWQVWLLVWTGKIVFFPW